MEISDGKLVTLNYTLKNKSGKIIDSSQKKGFSYIHGKGFLIPGLERELEGKNAGDEFQVTVEPKDGFGDYNESLVFGISKTKFGETEDLAAGMKFRVKTKEGEKILTIKEVEDNRVTVDMNHPLAGKTLYFDVSVIDVQEAKKEKTDSDDGKN